MIEYIKGILTELNPTEAVVEAAGVGYGLAITLPTYSALVGKEEKEVKLFVSEIIREDTHEVYGFATKQERQLFELLLTVSGVGAATARMILSAFSAEELRNAILSEDINLIKSVKGIGLKTAQRMVLELKDKLIKGEGSASETLFVSDRNEVVDEATSALQMLGFSKPNINKAIQAILKKNPSAKVEEIIKDALKML